jgi:mono/diheme cytochrome c family protein
MKWILALIAMVAAVQGTRSVWDGVYSEGQAKRGEALYADRCASCHAPDLSGIDQAPPLTGADFLADWNDLTVNDLFERIRVSMPADKPGSLERLQVADLLAFVLQKNRYPPGQGEVPSSEDALKAIKIAAKR